MGIGGRGTCLEICLLFTLTLHSESYKNLTYDNVCRKSTEVSNLQYTPLFAQTHTERPWVPVGAPGSRAPRAQQYPRQTSPALDLAHTASLGHPQGSPRGHGVAVPGPIPVILPVRFLSVLNIHHELLRRPLSVRGSCVPTGTASNIPALTSWPKRVDLGMDRPAKSGPRRGCSSPGNGRSREPATKSASAAAARSDGAFPGCQFL